VYTVHQLRDATKGYDGSWPRAAVKPSLAGVRIRHAMGTKREYCFTPLYVPIAAIAASQHYLCVSG
jgi:hypothetical protein